MEIQWGLVAAIVVYLVVVVGVGSWTMKRILGSEHYLVASYNMPAWLVVAVVMGDWVTATATLGVGQDAYRFGIGAALYPMAVGAGLVFLGFTFAGPFRLLKAMTIPEVLGALYDRKTRVLSGLVLALYYAMGLSNQLVGCGAIVSTLTGLSRDIALAISAIVTILIVIGGGVWALGVTNVAHMIVFWLGGSLAFVAGIQLVGGFGSIVARTPTVFWNPLNYGVDRMAALGISSFLGTIVAQAAVCGLFAAKDAKSAKVASVASGVFLVPVGIMYALMGIASFILFGEQLPYGLQAIPAILLEMHPVISAVAYCGLMAAVLSTAGPCLFVSSQMFTKDVFTILRPRATDREVLRVARLLVLLIGFASFLVSLSIFYLIEMSMFIFTFRIGLAVIMILAFVFGHRYRRICSASGAFSGLLCGAVTCVVWVLVGKPYGIHEFYPTVIVCLAVCILVSVIKPRPEPVPLELVRPR